MRLDKLQDTVKNSTRDDWVEMSCWDTRPSYKYFFDVVMAGKNSGITDVRTHNTVSCFKPNIMITMAFGLTIEGNDSIGKFYPNKEVTTQILDFFYAGALVWRDEYMWLDGFRVLMPQPRAVYDKKKGDYDYYCSGERLDFYKFVIDDKADFPTDRENFHLENKPWIWG